ncbi:MAG: SDR family NAD(P)-dependent oxidoreductase [Actinomycetota bacterium]|nr:SDR family NAD(P)-dependent oxidoreductase [Actinomycetota bacterium]
MELGLRARWPWSPEEARALVWRPRKGLQVRAEPVGCDIGTPGGVAALVEAAQREFSDFDILANNAGAGSNETILDALGRAQ